MALPRRVSLHVRHERVSMTACDWRRSAQRMQSAGRACEQFIMDCVTLIEYVRQLPGRGASAVWVIDVQFPQGDN